eukprot:332214_1
MMSQMEETTKAEQLNVVANNKDVSDREVIVQTLNSLESAPRERFWNIVQMMSQMEETTKAEQLNVVANNKDVSDREVIVQTLNSLESAPRERFWNIVQMIVVMIFIVITFIICHIALDMKLSSTITVMSFVGGIGCMIFITYNGW